YSSPPRRSSDLASTPGSRLSFFSTRLAHDAQVMPPTLRSMRAVVMGPSSLVRGGSGEFRVVARFVDCGDDVGGGERVGGGDGELAGFCGDVDARHASDLRDLFSDGVLAVAAGHAGDVVGSSGDAHGVSFRSSLFYTLGGYRFSTLTRSSPRRKAARVSRGSHPCGGRGRPS